MHKIPSPSDHEESMNHSGKKDQKSVFQIPMVSFQKKHQNGKEKNNRNQTALKQIPNVLETLGPMGSGTRFCIKGVGQKRRIIPHPENLIASHEKDRENQELDELLKGDFFCGEFI